MDGLYDKSQHCVGIDRLPAVPYKQPRHQLCFHPHGPMHSLDHDVHCVQRDLCGSSLQPAQGLGQKQQAARFPIKPMV